MSNIPRGQTFKKKQKKLKVCAVKDIIQKLCKKGGADSLGHVWKENQQALQDVRISTLEKLEEFLRKYPQCFNLIKPDFHIDGTRGGSGSRDSSPEVGAVGLYPLGKTVVEVTAEPFLCEKNSKHSEPCQDRCGKLHLCKFFLLSGLCRYVPCHYSHDIESKHNFKILRNHFMSHLSVDDLRVLFTRRKVRTSVTSPFVCRYYNKSLCKKGSNCPGLHLCKDFLLGSCNNECGLNHDFTDIDVGRRLKLFAVEPEDLAEILLDRVGTNSVSPGTFKYINPSLKRRTAYFQNTSAMGGVVSKQNQELYAVTNGDETRELDCVSRPFQTDYNLMPSSSGFLSLDAQPVAHVNSTRKEASQMVSTGKNVWGAPATTFHSSPPAGALQTAPSLPSLQSQSYAGSKKTNYAEAEEHGLKKTAKEMRIDGVVARLLTLNKKLLSFSPGLPSTSVTTPDVGGCHHDMESETAKYPDTRLELRKKDLSDGEITESEGEITDSLPEDEALPNGSRGQLDGKLHDGVLQARRSSSYPETGNWKVSGKEDGKAYEEEHAAADKKQAHGRRIQSAWFRRRKMLRLSASWDYKRRRGKKSAAQDGNMTSPGMDRSNTSVSSHHPQEMQAEDIGNFDRQEAEIKCRSLFRVASQDGKDLDHPPSEKDVQEIDTAHFSSDTARQKTCHRGVWETGPQSCKSGTTKRNHTDSWPSYGEMAQCGVDRKKKKEEVSLVSYMGRCPQDQQRVSKHRRELIESERKGASESMFNKSTGFFARPRKTLPSKRKRLSPNGWEQNDGQAFTLTRQSLHDQSSRRLGDWQGVGRKPRERNKIHGFSSQKTADDFVAVNKYDTSKDFSLTAEWLPGSENEEERRRRPDDERPYVSHHTRRRPSENAAEREREAVHERLLDSYHRWKWSGEKKEKRESKAEESLHVFHPKSSSKRQDMREVGGSGCGDICDPWLLESSSKSSRFSCHSLSQDAETWDDQTTRSQQTFDHEISYQGPSCRDNQSVHLPDGSAGREDLGESRKEGTSQINAHIEEIVSTARRSSSRHKSQVHTSRGSDTHREENKEDPFAFQVMSAEDELRGENFGTSRKRSGDNSASQCSQGKGDKRMKLRPGTNYEDYNKTSSRDWQDKVRPDDRAVNTNKQHAARDEWFEAEKSGSFRQGTEKDDWAVHGCEEHTRGSRHEALVGEFDEQSCHRSGNKYKGRKARKQFANYDDWKRADRSTADAQLDDQSSNGLEKWKSERDPWHCGKYSRVGKNEYQQRHRGHATERTYASSVSRSLGHHRNAKSRFRDGSRGEALKETEVNDGNNNSVESDFDGAEQHGYYGSDLEMEEGYENSRHGWQEDGDHFLHTDKWLKDHDQNDANGQDRESIWKRDEEFEACLEDDFMTGQFVRENQPGNVLPSQRERWAQREVLERPHEDDLSGPPDHDFLDVFSSFSQEQNWNHSGQEDEDTEGQFREAHCSKICSDDLRHHLKRKRKMPREQDCEPLSINRKRKIIRKITMVG